MLTVELLIAPLRLLITALGTGELPPGNPAEQVRTCLLYTSPSPRDS